MSHIFTADGIIIRLHPSRSVRGYPPFGGSSTETPLPSIVGGAHGGHCIRLNPGEDTPVRRALMDTLFP